MAFVIGDRSAETCARLWSRIPEEYRQGRSFSDFWKSYRPVFEEDETHRQVGKSSGEMAHVERFLDDCARSWPDTSGEREQPPSQNGCSISRRNCSWSGTTKPSLNIYPLPIIRNGGTSSGYKTNPTGTKVQAALRSAASN